MFNNQIIAGAAGQGGGSFYSYSIDQSLRFNDGDSAKLSRTPTSSGNSNTWTWSAWVKRSALNATSHLFGAVGSTYDAIWFDSSHRIQFVIDSANAYNLIWSPRFRDVGAFYHLLMRVDTTQATASDRVRLYVNGEQITSLDTNTPPAQNYNWLNINTTDTHYIGANNTSGYFDGYMAEVNFIDGTALDATSFGETIGGVWVPKAYDTADGAYGTNGFYLPFDDSAAIGDDESGNTNDFTANNLAATDIVSDSPTDNAVTMDYNNRKGVTLSEGNLHFNVGTSQGVCATMPTATTGKWYFEFKVNGAITPSNPIVWGFSSQEKQTFANYTTNPRDAETSTLSAYTDTSIWQVLAKESNVQTAINPPVAQRPAQNSIIGLAYDADTGKAWLAVNNVWIDSSGGTTGNPSTGANPTHTFTAGIAVFPAAFDVGGVQPQGILQADDDVLTYTPPTDFLTIKSSNMPEPTISPNAAEQADDYFNTVIWSGDSTSDRDIVTNHATDLVWIKSRSNATNHYLFDSIRGVNNQLLSNATSAEAVISSNRMTAFNSDGFQVGNFDETNGSGKTFVGWSWKAGGAAVSNTDGSITSSVSAAPDAGFSIVSWTGTGAAGTIGHGLSSAPEHIIVKNRDTAGRIWLNYVKAAASDAETDYLSLNGTGALVDNADIWNDTAPTSTVFTVGSNASANESGDAMIAYCFHSVEGYLKCGSYVGNGSTDGTFVYTGFRPAFLLIKETGNANSWEIYDTARDPDNVASQRLFPNDSQAEATTNPSLDMLSNGFKARAGNTGINRSGGNYIYLAFAEAPFKYANAR